MPKKSDVMVRFFKLVAMPTLERVERGLPETLMDMAKYFGVQYGTITRWHRKAKVMGISQISVDSNYIPEIPQNEDEEEWAIFMRQLTADAAQKGATAPTRTLYAQLKGKMPKTNIDLKIGLSADEIAKRNLEASRQLEESGF